MHLSTVAETQGLAFVITHKQEFFETKRKKTTKRNQKIPKYFGG